MNVALIPKTMWVAIGLGVVAVNAANLLDRTGRLIVASAAVGVLSTAVARIAEILIRQRGK
jgi:hypothetical protein